MANFLKLANEKEYLQLFLKENCRLDGRELLERRNFIGKKSFISTADGSSLIRSGNNVVCCGIKAEFHEMSMQKINGGLIVPNVEFSSQCSKRYYGNLPSAYSQYLTKELNLILKKFEVATSPNLTIISQRLFWCLYIDVNVISHDGNIFDIILLSALTALNNLELPTINIDKDHLETLELDDEGDNVEINNLPSLKNISVDEKRKWKLLPSNDKMPILISFTIIGNDRALFDTTEDEENIICSLATGSISSTSIASYQDLSLNFFRVFTINNEKNVEVFHSFEYFGRYNISESYSKQLINLALKSATEIRKEILEES
ncbi:hypothetical protein SNEBB_002538 [Seison nebaliae]|nr:hypothetical protein SNEBB_002538 [Seison nebaliae]